MALLFARYLCSRTLGPNGVVNLRLLIHTGTRIAVSFKPSALGVGKPVLDGLVVIGRNPYHKTISFHVLLYVVPTTVRRLHVQLSCYQPISPNPHRN